MMETKEPLYYTTLASGSFLCANDPEVVHAMDDQSLHQCLTLFFNKDDGWHIREKGYDRWYSSLAEGIPETPGQGPRAPFAQLFSTQAERERDIAMNVRYDLIVAELKARGRVA